MVENKHQWKAWIYLSPAIVLLLVFTVWPIINTLIMAFSENYSALAGVGGAAAEQLAKAREDGGAEFSSIEDFEIRSGAGKSTVALLKACGAFGDLPDSDQISLFGF